MHDQLGCGRHESAPDSGKQNAVERPTNGRSAGEPEEHVKAGAANSAHRTGGPVRSGRSFRERNILPANMSVLVPSVIGGYIHVSGCPRNSGMLLSPARAYWPPDALGRLCRVLTTGSGDVFLLQKCPALFSIAMGRHNDNSVSV